MLRARLEQRPESVQSVYLAAEERYWDGLELAAQGRNDGAIYFFGFAAEMWLKVAYARADGATLADALQSWFGPARQLGKALQIDHEQYHSLYFWARVLIERRRRRNRPLTPSLAQALTTCANDLYNDWWVAMRYHPSAASSPELESVFAAANWLRANVSRVWR